MGNKNGQKGYAALFAVVVTAGIGLVVVSSILFVGNSSLKSTRTFLVSSQVKGITNACAELALQELVASSVFLGAHTVPVGGGECSYTISQPSGTTRHIGITGEKGGVVRKIKIILSFNLSPPILSITSWQEVADL
jgi:hypothetical protein